MSNMLAALTLVFRYSSAGSALGCTIDEIVQVNGDAVAE